MLYTYFFNNKIHEYVLEKPLLFIQQNKLSTEH